ncbi:MAG: helix-turn-helix domain-containing protein [Rhodobacter sp.]|nr:helix-turn-helix domain-containing protein [Rhodobacter sp.]
MDDILTIRDVAARLKLGERTITAMLGCGELPGFKLRGRWRLRKVDFECWLEAVANGGESEAVTATILSGGTDPTPGEPALSVAAPPVPQDKAEAPMKIEPLTQRVTQAELHRRFIAALGEKVHSHNDFDQKPFEAKLASPLPPRIRLYIFNATRPPGGRPLGEHKVQLIVPGQKRGDRANFDQSGGRIVLLAGYAAEEDVFILWDAGLYQDFAWSRNVQVKAETIIEASAGRIAEQERRLRPADGTAVTERLLASRPERLVEALARRIAITRERMMQD